MPDLRLQRYGPAEALRMLDTLTDIYTEAYVGGRYDDNPAVYNREAFIQRTTRQAGEGDFTLIIGRVGDDIAGYSFGLPQEAGRWPRADCDPPPPAEVVESARFFVVELIVRGQFRGQGHSRVLMDAILADRPEPYAALTANPGGFPQAMYLRWGWQILCKMVLPDSGVTFDFMIKQLDPDRAAP